MKTLIGRLIAKPLHVCNSEPWCMGDKQDFYALKVRLLERYGELDGHDVQHIPGKPCWSCEGTGGLYERGGCYKCYGSGWYTSPVWVVLERRRLGRFVFHTPKERIYKKPQPDVTNIDGYVKHANYGWRTIDRAALFLALLYDRKVFRRLLSERVRKSRIGRIVTRRCVDCRRRLWSTKRWRCPANGRWDSQ